MANRLEMKSKYYFFLPHSPLYTIIVNKNNNLFKEMSIQKTKDLNRRRTQKKKVIIKQQQLDQY